MTILSDEIPFTNDAIRIYLKEINAEIDKLRPAVSLFNKLVTRKKLAQKRLDQHEHVPNMAAEVERSV